MIARRAAAAMARSMILVVDNYDSFTWNLVHYLMELGQQVEVVRNDQITVADAMVSGADAFLISPGPCTPDKAGISLDLVAACAASRRPLLGVCLGHQAIGQHFGGRVERGALMHGKTSPILHDGTGVFEAAALAVYRDPLSFAYRARRARVPDRQRLDRGRNGDGFSA